jgi:prepilin signal peptidase PulO-like enzyme (type II secretory pathway)
VIPWYRNLPIISWLLQRGRCFCPLKQKVSPHYLVLEVLCAGLFLTNVLLGQDAIRIFFLCCFVAYALLAGTIDLERRELPTVLSAQLAVIGLIYAVSGTNPFFHSLDWITNLVSSLLGLCAGAAVVGALMLVGKIFYGPKSYEFSPPVQIEIDGKSVRSRQGKEPWDEGPVSDYLIAPWERLEFHAGNAVEVVTLGKLGNGYSFRSNAVDRIVVPRDAIGLDDLKWLAALGVWVGPLGALVTMGLASVLACVGIVFLVIKNRKKPKGMAFGPWLGLAAYLIMLWKLASP